MTRDRTVFEANLHDDRIRHETDLEKRQRLDGWLQASVRFLVLSNAGGAVATLTFIGGALKGNHGFDLAIWAMAFFICGTALVGFVILGQLNKAWLAELSPAQPADGSCLHKLIALAYDKGSYWHSPFIAGSFILFLIGAILGIIGLAIGGAAGATLTAV
jgi:hypothetical protein